MIIYKPTKTLTSFVKPYSWFDPCMFLYKEANLHNLKEVSIGKLSLAKPITSSKQYIIISQPHVTFAYHVFYVTGTQNCTTFKL